MKRSVRRPPICLALLLIAPLAAGISSCSVFDLVPFSVVSYSPQNGVQASLSGKTVEIVFSKAANRALTEQAFSITGDGNPVAGVISWPDDSTLLFTPDQPLQKLVLYQVEVTTEAEDSYGRDLSKQLAYSFTTRTSLTRPTVTGASPTDNAQITNLLTPISIQFSQTMDPATLYAAFSISPSVTGLFSLTNGGKTLTFTPTADLQWQTDYTVTVAKTAADTESNALGTDFTTHFEVGTVTTAPTVGSVKSADGSITLAPSSPTASSPTVTSGWESNEGLVITFSQPVDTSSAMVSVSLSPSAQYNVAEQDTQTTSTLTYKFTSPLTYGATYTLTIASGIEGAQGNKTTASETYYFTVNGPATEPPTIAAVYFATAPNSAASKQQVSPPGSYTPVDFSSYNTGGLGFFDFYIDLAPGASIDPLSAARALSISSTNSSLTFLPNSYALITATTTSPAVGTPAIATNINQVVVRVYCFVTDGDTAATGIVTLTLATTMQDSNGTPLQTAYVLPIYDEK